MAKELSAKCKTCRRAGEKLFLKGERCNTAKCAIVKRNYPPGFHGNKGRPRRTDYGLQLNEKQKAKKQYRLLEKQFRLTFGKALKKTGNTGDNFIMLLEMRLDNVVYRLGLAESRNQARQMVSHGLMTVNGRKVTIPSCQLKIGDTVEVKSNKKDAKLFKNTAEKIKSKEIPGWLRLDAKKFSGRVQSAPSMAMVNPTFNMQMIIEFYSK
jgi:small subunit ribosomal protein S4